MTTACATDRIDAIQHARGLAAMLVVMVHAIELSARVDTAWPDRFASAMPNLRLLGATGVDLFFVISGFVMAHIVAHARTLSVEAFLRRRISRIVPLFAVVSLIYAVLNPWGEQWGWRSSLYSVLILPVFDWRSYHPPALYIGWTLGFEFAFYVLVAMALVLGAGRAAVTRLLALTLTAVVLGCVVRPDWAPLGLLLNPLQGEFSAGVALWIAYRAGWVQRHGRAAMLLGAGVLTIEFGLGLAEPFSAHFDQAVDGTSGLVRTLEWGVPAALVLAGLLARARRGTRMSRVGAVIGDASYAIYLTHLFAIAGVLALARAGWLHDVDQVVLAALIAAPVLGLVVHHAVEQPLLRLARCARRLSSQPAYSASTVSPSRLTSANPPLIGTSSGSAPSRW